LWKLRFRGYAGLVPGAHHLVAVPVLFAVTAAFETRLVALDMRDNNGAIRTKRSDTQVGTLREEYGQHVAEGYRSDAQLGTVLKKEGLASLSELLKSDDWEGGSPKDKQCHSAP